MKISKITVYKVKPRWIFVKLSTDEGIDGWGEMISGTKTETVVAGAYEVGERFLLGQNPFEIERLFQEMHRSFFRGGPIHGTIVSGLEMALWDIKGKALYVPRGYAHRTINTGDEVLTAFYVFDADAGHDYGTIETKGYRHIVCEINGEVTVLDNPRW